MPPGHDHFSSLMRTLFVALTALIMTRVLGPVVVVARLLRRSAGADVDLRAMRRAVGAVDQSRGRRPRSRAWRRATRSNARGAVFIANHVSWFDIFALAAEVPWCSFVAKTELRRIPLFGFAAECVGIVFLDRDNRKQAFESYKVAAAEVQRGRAIIVCPEGTRGHDYHLRPFKKGPFVLAIASQAPVVPTIVYGAREVMPKGSFRIRSGDDRPAFPRAGADASASTTTIAPS